MLMGIHKTVLSKKFIRRERQQNELRISGQLNFTRDISQTL